MGTWCGDSKEEVPKFYKVLEACDFPMEQLTVIAVSRQRDMYKQSPNHEEKGLNIHRVPTVIFYKNGKEINRIVEHPIATFEEDILNIITKNDYKSNYQIVAKVDKILKRKGVKGLKRKHKKLLKNYKNKVSSMFELNTYGRILLSTDRMDEAIAVFKFNTKLFPDEPRTYMSLANTLGLSDQKEKAIKVLEKAIKLHPENQDLKENLEVIKSN
jgi:tetratricopeptide (TPR) repeat protein